MKILFLCEFYTGYVVQLWSNLKKYYPELRLSLLTYDSEKEEYLSNLTLQEDEAIYTAQRSKHYIKSYYDAIRQLPRFDIIQPLWMEKHYGIYAGSIRNKADHLYISVGGSDLYRHSKRPIIRFLQKRLIKRASSLSAENTFTRDYFYSVYGDDTRKIPFYITRFGVDVIDSIREHDFDKKSLRSKWGIPQDKIVVMLGHNGRKEHQHLEMISAIGRMDRNVIQKCFFVIPMTYGVPSDEYVKQVQTAMANVTDNYRILMDFLDVNQMAETTVFTDVMIHMQTTDQLSSTMMAHLYQGNVVLAGAWLPYSDIKESGIKLIDVNDFNELEDILSQVIANIADYKDMCITNSQNVYKFSSWEYCVKNWYRIYDNLVNGKVKEDR